MKQICRYIQFGSLVILPWIGTMTQAGEGEAAPVVYRETPLLLQYGFLITSMLIVIGLMIIVYRSMQKHAAQYPPEVGESILRLWEIVAERARRSPEVWDDELVRVVTPLARAIARRIQQEGGSRQPSEAETDDDPASR